MRRMMPSLSSSTSSLRVSRLVGFQTLIITPERMIKIVAGMLVTTITLVTAPHSPPVSFVTVAPPATASEEVYIRGLYQVRPLLRWCPSRTSRPPTHAEIRFGKIHIFGDVPRASSPPALNAYKVDSSQLGEDSLGSLEHCR